MRREYFSYSMRNQAVWSDNLYWSIHKDDLKTFKIVVNNSIHTKYVNEIISRSRVEFLIYLNSIGYSWKEEDVLHAVHYRNLPIVKLLDEYGAPMTTFTLHLAIRYGSIEVLAYLRESHKELFHSLRESDACNDVMESVCIKAREDILKLLLSESFSISSHRIKYIIDNRKEKDEDIKKMLCILHDHNIEYEWGCQKGTCVHCNDKRKAILSEDWILESYTYNSYFQWLPLEVAEDLLDLF